ncbi:hypothetical protein SAY87_023229 [Trapa incisa]|uniref:Uncharacterized protein n=1 Tax=Trapa incisa TaxID=236973 RepID=A0AAN7Q653_9MYRT|nr:hypothetical protein SAY87_023229 [Trapa incisa]
MPTLHMFEYEWSFFEKLSRSCCPCFTHANFTETRVLKAEEELLEESLPLQAGSRVYKLEGIKPNTWYEVKISYPASIPACFTLQKVPGLSGLGINPNRRLLNTEKLIFKTDNLHIIQRQVLLWLGILILLFECSRGKLCCRVDVEPEGTVSLKNVRERELIVFNIVSHCLNFSPAFHIRKLYDSLQ